MFDSLFDSVTIEGVKGETPPGGGASRDSTIESMFESGENSMMKFLMLHINY